MNALYHALEPGPVLRSTSGETRPRTAVCRAGEPLLDARGAVLMTVAIGVATVLALFV